jgi:glucose/arabinose dehydrogenase
MTKISSLVTATAIASLLLMGAASAQTTAPAKTEAPKTDTTKTDTTKTEPTKTEAKAPAEKKAEKPRTPGSLECSKQADEKGLKGKERKKFRTACKKEFADKEKAGADKAK